VTSYAKPAHVQVRLGRPITDTAQAQAFLDDAEVLIRTRVRDLDARVDADEAFEETVVMVEANAVVRVLRNPEGLRSVTVAVDDGSVTKTRDQTLSAGGLFITDDEWDLLLPGSAAAALSSPVRYVPGWADRVPTGWGRP